MGTMQFKGETVMAAALAAEPPVGKMPGEVETAPAAAASPGAVGRMPGEGEAVMGAPSLLQQFSVFHKAGAEPLAEALVGLGPYTQRGTTANFTVYYDNSLGTQGQNMADAVLANCEWDLFKLRGWFGEVAAGPFTVYIDPGSFGAYHANCAATELHLAAFAGTDGNLENMLNVAEADEVMMNNQGAGWNCGASAGEGLSRVLATQRYPASLDGFASAASWLNSSRPDWVPD
jgi:hypothetical protein